MIADDLTGALDSGAALVNAGISTVVLVDAGGDIETAASGHTAVVINSETRHANRERAYEVVHGLCRRASELHIPLIYKKTDSAMRGNIGAELEAALRGSGRRFVYFAPAYPQIGRCTVNGIQLINDIPVSETSFGRDLLNPVTDSHVPTILHAQTDLPVTGEGIAIPATPTIWLADSSSQGELSVAAERIYRFRNSCVIAGCAGLACEIAKFLPSDMEDDAQPHFDLTAPFLIICGSIHPVSRSQVEYAFAHGMDRILLETDALISDDAPTSLREWVDRANTLLNDTGTVILENSYDPHSSLTAAEKDLTASRLPGAMGRFVREILENNSVGTLMAFGGDILSGVVAALKIEAIEPLREVRPGIVLAETAWRGRCLTLITKAGSFGSRELITELAEEFRERSPR